MKSNFLSVLSALLLLVFASSCQHSNDDVKPIAKSAANSDDTSVSIRNGKVVFKDGTQNDLEGAIQVVRKSQGLLNKSSVTTQNVTPYDEFDMSKVIVVEVSGSTAKAYVFKELKSAGDTQKALSIYNYGKPDARAIVVKTSSQAVEYIDYTNGDKTVVTQEQGIIKVTTASLNKKAGVAGRSLLVSCGDGTAHCIQDAYSNHGWISVWAFVQTAFIPWTAAGIAAACAVHNC